MDDSSQYPQIAPLSLSPPPTSGQYITRIGGNNPSNLKIAPPENMQIQKNSSGSPQVTTTASPMTQVGAAATSMVNSLQQARQMYMQRFGQGNQGTGPGGTLAGNPTDSQVGPPGPGQGDNWGVNPNAPASSIPTGDTGAEGIPTANAAAGPSSGNSPTGGSGGAGAAGMGIASALSGVSKAFGQESQQDLKIAQNAPKPDINPANSPGFNFSPFFGGGGVSV
jgi:hypothetical protein